MCEVIFRTAAGRFKVSAERGENLLEIARKANIAIDAPCSGNASCGKCRVRLIGGTLDSPKTRHISDAEYAAGWRLSCVSRLIGDVEIEVPAESSSYKTGMKIADLSSEKEQRIFEDLRREIADAGIGMKNGFRSIGITLDAPTPDDTMPDNERLICALRGQLGTENIELPYCVIRKLSAVLRAADFRICCVVEQKSDTVKVYDIMPFFARSPICGLAVDIGTTTVSAVIADLETGDLLAKASAGNGQIRYGADVINRIIESTRNGGGERLQAALIRETLEPLIDRMCGEAKIGKENIYRMCAAANTTMNHLLLGLYADPIRTEPYIPTFFSVGGIRAAEVGIELNPCAELILAPNVGSYVGGDITAGALSAMLWNREGLSLFLDLGTNGEIVFGNNEFLMSCACSAGPAFEGGDIGCGMRAADGAIEACTVDRETMEPEYSVIGACSPLGICGSGIIDVIAALFRAGIIDARGKFIREGRRIRRDEYGIGSYVLAFCGEKGAEKDIVLTEVDIDNFIRAKGAIFSGIMTMLSSLGFDPSVLERIDIAGGIGSGINIANAVSIGMLPDLPGERFRYIGNSSLAGAYAMTVSDEACEKVHEIARSITYLELSAEAGYMDEFVAACFLPHTNADLFPSVGGH